MSSTTEVPKVPECEPSEKVDTSPVEEGVAGPQTQVGDQSQPVARAARVSTLFTSGLLNSMKKTEEPEAGKKVITEEEAASILVLMRRKYANTASETRMGGPPSSQAVRRSASVASSTSSVIEPPKKPGKQVARPTRKREPANLKNLAPVARRGSSTAAVFVPTAKTKPKQANVKEPSKCMRSNYNVFRTKASKLLGTKLINTCREGTSFNGKIAALWKEVSEDDKAGFGDWTLAEQKAYFVKLATGPQSAEKTIKVAIVKEIKVATRIQPRRNVEGKTKK